MKHFKMRKFGWCLAALILATSISASAQQPAQVKGSVMTEGGEVLQGVSIEIKETNGKQVQATTTNDKGAFIVGNLVAGKEYDFSFSYIGFETNSVKSFHVNAGVNSLSNKMKIANAAMNEEVVVTALGIRREEKSLGYAAQAVKENAVKDAKSNNWVNTLTGKVAGLNIQGAGAGPVGSSRITLRGESSLNLENNQALIILDGVPVSSKITGTNSPGDVGVDFGSGVSDINPDDIEKITVLKGPGATALYGSRAAGGALIITTKSGQRKNKGVGVTLNSNISFDRVNRWPAYQYEYGEGRTQDYYSYGDSPDGTNTSTGVAAGRAWGPKFNGQSYFQFDPSTPDNLPTERTPWVADKNYIKDFFKTGFTFSNSVAIDATSDKGSARLSVTHLKNQYILPNGGFERINVGLSVNHTVSDKIRVSGKVNYTNKTSDNVPIAGYSNHSSMYFFILGSAPNIRPEWFLPYWTEGKEGILQRKPFNPGPENPYLTFYEMLNKVNKNGVIGNVAVYYDISDKLKLMLRSGLDMAYEFRSEQLPFSLTSYPRGRYREQNIFNYEVNTDALLTYTDKINSAINFSVSAGANAMRQSYNYAGMYADNLSQPGIYQISNSLDQAVADPLRTQKSINSVYGLGQVSYKEKIFIDLTGRNDWSSTLPYGNNSFFYPSVSTSFLLSDIFQLPSQISFAKVRASWAQVGNDTRPYQTDKYYDRIYSNSFTNPSVLFNRDLKPEIRSSYEFGIDLRLLKNRLGFDVTVYNDKSRNQILAIPLDPTSGYSSALLNAGLINSKGIEVAITGKPIVSRNFNWNTTLTWSRNRSYVRELAEGVTNQQLYGFANVTIEARVGGRMGDMYGRGFQRSPEGKIIYSSAGLPAPLDPQIKKWGNAFADWKAGLLNEFSFKSFRISILFDGQMGGSMFSQTNHKLNTLGKTKVTLPGRDGGIVGDGVILNPATHKYEPNTINVPALSYYDNYYAQSNTETNIFDCSFLKLREARIEYSLPTKFLSSLRIQQTSIALYGRELFNITKFPGFDPEGGTFNNGNLTPGVEITQFPSTRSVGVNLTLKF